MKIEFIPIFYRLAVRLIYKSFQLSFDFLRFRCFVFFQKRGGYLSIPFGATAAKDVKSEDIEE